MLPAILSLGGVALTLYLQVGLRHDTLTNSNTVKALGNVAAGHSGATYNFSTREVEKFKHQIRELH